METHKNVILHLPTTPGIYIYKDTNGEILYIGKAKNLKKRVSWYFSNSDEFPTKINRLVHRIHSIETIQTQNELDAILLEAELIRSHKPKYNSISKDDKSPIYVLIDSQSELPTIRIVRKRDIPDRPYSVVFGPFQSSYFLQKLFINIRHIIPFCMQKKRSGKPCFYTHLGLCDPCPSYISKLTDSQEKKRLISVYKHHIYQIMNILSGKSKMLITEFERSMKQYAQSEQYEEANRYKQLIDKLTSFLMIQYDPYYYVTNDYAVGKIHNEETLQLLLLIQKYNNKITNCNRVECIDISHVYGSYTVGSLVAFEEGAAIKQSYRRFKILGTKINNDTYAISQIIERRLKHSQWQYPNLFIIDGGKGQVQAAKDILKHNSINIPVIGIAKRFENIIIANKSGFVTVTLPYDNAALAYIKRIRDEAHRFAHMYHVKRRSMAFIK